MEKRFFCRTLFALIAGITALAASACGPGPYGFARYYVPTDAEKPFDKQSSELPYSIVAADPAKYQDRLIAWFGIVKQVTPAKDGKHLVVLSHNSHRERHLCEGQSTRSCRVTVNFKETGIFSAILALRPEDLKPGLQKLQPGSLMRVFGKVRCSKDEDDALTCEYNDQGGLVLDGVYYRQWPSEYFMTTRAAEALRR